MKFFSWNIEKNEQLIKERNVSFEEVVFFIEKGQLQDIIKNHDRGNYPRQMMLVVKIKGDSYLIPFIETGTEVFLKTIIPGRKVANK